MRGYYLISVLFLLTTSVNAQQLDDYESYDVEQFYEKVELDSGSLNEDGDEIEYIFVESEIDLKTGLYEIELTEGPGELYEIKGTDIFVKFRFYYGYAGYSDKCILEVKGGSYIPATIYKLD